MATYTPTIGLEIHAELKTRTKMFCNSKNDPDEVRPNVNICPVCMAHPGTLPVLNKEAIKHVLRVGTALGGTLADYTEFDRKNYFYPDLPKGYQISQYEFPLVSGGKLRDVDITRVHLEEDTARSQHAKDGSLVDYNRAGLPLMELVTEPVIHDAKTAREFAEELQLLLRALGAGEANMEKGQMRVEANISVSASETLGTKVEVKNLNSFKSVERAIIYEVERQIEAIERGEKIVQETRGFDEDSGETFSQRIKEDSHDYRYFPDPDIPKLHISRIAEFSNDSLKKTMPELPWEKREKLQSMGLQAEDVAVLVSDATYSSFYDSVIHPIDDAQVRKVAINFLLNDIRGKNPPIEALERVKGGLAVVSGMFVAKEVSSPAAKTIVFELLEKGGDPRMIASEKGLLQNNDADAIQKLADELISENGSVAEEVKGGKVPALKFLIGQGMKKSKGSVNPAELESVLKTKLSV